LLGFAKRRCHRKVRHLGGNTIEIRMDVIDVDADLLQAPPLTTEE
jgi:hypothetical protein